MAEQPSHLTPLPAEEWDDDVRAGAEPAASRRRGPTRATPATSWRRSSRHQPLTHAFLTFNAHLLLNSTLSARVREVAVLRAALASGSDYLWDHHVPLAERAGLTSAEIEDDPRG